MGEAVFDEAGSRFADQPLPAAVVLCRTEHGNLHAGLFHRDLDGTPVVLHLGWEDRLLKKWEWPKVWAVPDTEPENLRSVGGLCRLIWDRFRVTKTFPYALRFSHTSFDSDGRLKLGEGARGLTCATLICAVFSAAGIPLVREDNWPIRKDADLAFLKSVEPFATKEHLAIMRREVEEGCKRIQPQEVIGACACETPADFEPCSAAGQRAVATIDGRE